MTAISSISVFVFKIRKVYRIFINMRASLDLWHLEEGWRETSGSTEGRPRSTSSAGKK